MTHNGQLTTAERQAHQARVAALQEEIDNLSLLNQVADGQYRPVEFACEHCGLKVRWGGSRVHFCPGCGQPTTTSREGVLAQEAYFKEQVNLAVLHKKTTLEAVAFLSYAPSLGIFLWQVAASGLFWMWAAVAPVIVMIVAVGLTSSTWRL